MSRFLALDADAGGLFVAAGGPARGGPAVEQTLAAADDLGPLTPANAAARGARLKELLAAAAVKPAPLLVLVGRDRVILKDITHPPAAPADEPAVVRFQASRDLSDAADDVVMDYLPLPPAADGQRRATAVFVRREVLVAARQLAEAAGLRLAGVSPRPFVAPMVVERAAATQPAAVVTAWPGGGEFTVVADGRVRYTRPLSAPPDALSGEVRRNLSVYASQHPDAPLALVLVADAAGGLADRLADGVSVPVRGFDPTAGQPGGELIAPSLRGRLAAPLALLAVRAGGDALPINFAVPRAPRAEPGKNRRRILFAALAAVLLLGLGGLFAYLQLDQAAGRVAALQEQKKGLQKRIDDLQPNVNRLRAADEFVAREVVVLDELYELGQRVPDVKKVSVVEFDLTARPPPVKKTGPTPAATPGPAGGAGTASNPPPAKAPPVPIAGLRVKLRSTDAEGGLVQKLVDTYGRDKYYARTVKAVSPVNEAGNKGVEFVVTADLFHRPPAAYTSRMTAAPPPPPTAVPAAGPADEGVSP